jgi:hypothetical protein
MKSYKEWSLPLVETDSRDEKKNSYGGLSPHNAEEKKIHKHADLITLPPEVKGTNCGNCKFVKDMKKGVGYCTHHDLECYVTDRMCCSYWNHEKVKRMW